eukprot:TRINITY_DN192_c0_g1_i1.p1 TRINITY_DN192_c0_g1~~TRINITY_DN192_c0_g1_i1.p1  ORF type:complete len:242 (-),score=45.53 TRINITY_DN192_c0_g1_i1:62-694(-)
MGLFMRRIGAWFYNTYLFLKSWYDSPSRMGALFPSFSRTGKMLASVIKDPENVRVVELGAGTGQVTEQIIKAGVRLDKFATIEFDPNFCEEIAKKNPGMKIFNIDAADIATKLPKEFVGHTDYIISTLPLITLGVEKAKEVAKAVFKTLKPGGVYVQITYTPFKPKYMKKLGLRATKLCISWLNLPPTHIWRLCPKIVSEEESRLIPSMT